MSVYEDLEKRKLFQKLWARERVLKKRTTEIIQKSVHIMDDILFATWTIEQS
jgi:hypothetical protein